MKSWQIFSHSWRQVFGNLGAALRVSAVPFLLGQALVFMTGLHNYPNQQALQMAIQRGDVALGLVFLSGLVGIITSLWIAVAWHRYVLTEEKGGIVPPFHVDRILGYFGKGFLIGLITIIAIVVLAFAGAAIVAGLARSAGMNFVMSAGGALFFQALFLIILLPALILITRLSAMLPGVALRAGVPLWSGWEATRGQNMVIAGILVLTLALTLVLQLPGLLVPMPGILIIWAAISAWISMMVGVSVLTTLYGHYVEGRPLV